MKPIPDFCLPECTVANACEHTLEGRIFLQLPHFIQESMNAFLNKQNRQYADTLDVIARIPKEQSLR